MTAPFNIDDPDADPDEGLRQVGDLVRYTRTGSNLGRVGKVTHVWKFDITVEWLWPDLRRYTCWAGRFEPWSDPDALARPVRRLLAAIAMCAALQEGRQNTGPVDA